MPKYSKYLLMKNGKVSGEIPDDKCYSLASYFTSGIITTEIQASKEFFSFLIEVN